MKTMQNNIKNAINFLLPLFFLSFIAVIVSFIGSGLTSVSIPKSGQTAYKAENYKRLNGMPASQGQRFTVDETGVCVADNLTGLMWARNPDSAVKTWHQAQDYAKNLTLCGYSDWRLPDGRELRTLINYEHTDAAAWLNRQGFSNVQPSVYWSSDTYRGTALFASGVSMSDGLLHAVNKKGSDHVWPVRAIQ